MFAWGENSIGCYLGLGKEIASPTKLPDNPAISNVKVLAAANSQCFALSVNGSVYCFGTSKDESCVGNAPSMQKLDFENVKIVDIFAGGEHMVAVADDGHAYGWGMNTCGQIGRKGSTGTKCVSIPKKIPLPDSKRVVQVSCGHKHTLVLLNSGSVYAMGSNSFGQLGIKDCLATNVPTEISALCGLPIAQVVSGGWHSFCVTISGKVFGWGRNNFGQLGLGDVKHRNTPCLLKMLNSEVVKYVDAGDYHTAVLTQDGRVFTFGASDKGQLGHDIISDFEINPRRICELKDSVVSQVACGRRHTVAFVPVCSHQIYACGSGALGQLGLRSIIDSVKVPTIIKGPWQFEDGSSSYNIKQLVVKGNQSFAVLCSSSEEFPMDFRNIPAHRRIWSMTSALCEEISLIGLDVKVPPDVITQLGCIMTSQSCINASFLAENHHETSELYSGLNLTKARQLFSKVGQCRNKNLRKKIKTYFSRDLLPSLVPGPVGIEALRLYVTLLEFSLFHSPNYYEILLLPFVDKLLQLSQYSSVVLDQWYRSLGPEVFMTLIKICQNCIVTTVKKDFNPDDLRKVSPMLDFLQKLNKINDYCDAGDAAIVDFQTFYIPELYDCHLIKDYQLWFNNPETLFSFCQYPFVLNAKAKTNLLRADAYIQMIDASRKVDVQNLDMLYFQFYQAYAGQEMLKKVLQSPLAEVEVNRDNLVSDAMEKISLIENLKLPFRVKFVDEEELDYGAARKEFLMLALDKMANPEYGIFHCNKDSNVVWFSDYTADSSTKYHLFGILCGLAVYNCEIIKVNLPLVLYKKLLGKDSSLCDLKQFDPDLGNRLQMLLDYVEQDGNTIEKAFGLMFTIVHQASGEVRKVDLIENGENVPVTRLNRSQYVDAYVDYVVNRSIESQFNSFGKGFLKVCDTGALKLYRPEELREMFVGSQNCDWGELEKSTKYEGEFSAKHRVIIWFWEVFHSMEIEAKLEFVCFLTGYSRIPIDGLRFTILPINIERSDDESQESVDDYLPVAQPYSNILKLPQYTSKAALEAKLRVAVETPEFPMR